VEPTGQIPPQPWMALPETQQVMAAFQVAGLEARFIGGCVRDSILKRHVRDIDIATPAPPERVIDLLQNAGIRVIPTGLAHGTVTAVIGDRHFEITTLRIDVKTDGRHAQVVFTDDWSQDAARRDFTINALSCDMVGNVYDPYNGLKDLGNGYIRFVGSAQKRVEEDLLRVLRFFRFLAEYGRYPVNGDALQACNQIAPRLGELSGERVRGEMFRILTAPNPATTLAKMRGERVLQYVLDEAGDVGRLRALAWLLERGVKFEAIGIAPIRRFAALLDPSLTPDQVKVVAARFKLSNRDRKALLTMTAAAPVLSADMSDSELRLACFQVGGPLTRDRALLAWAGDIALEAHLPPVRTAAWRRIVETAHDWPGVEFPLHGRDVITLGINPGPRIGELLNLVQEWWLIEDFQPDFCACLNKLKQLIGASP